MKEKKVLGIFNIINLHNENEIGTVPSKFLITYNDKDNYETLGISHEELKMQFIIPYKKYLV